MNPDDNIQLTVQVPTSECLDQIKNGEVKHLSGFELSTIKYLAETVHLWNLVSRDGAISEVKGNNKAM
jgi:hypothetical protein